MHSVDVTNASGSSVVLGTQIYPRDPTRGVPVSEGTLTREYLRRLNYKLLDRSSLFPSRLSERTRLTHPNGLLCPPLELVQSSPLARKPLGPRVVGFNAQLRVCQRLGGIVVAQVGSTVAITNAPRVKYSEWGRHKDCKI